MNDKENQIKEYNEKYYPLINNTSIILHSFDHAIKKAGAYDEVMNQLKILGWNDEWKSFVIEAVNYYADFLKGKHQSKLSEGSVVISKEEYEDLRLLETKYGLPTCMDGCITAYGHRLMTGERLVDQSRKQAVKEVLGKLHNSLDKSIPAINGVSVMLIKNMIDEIAKEFGVEVQSEQN